jgi:hypothetical protein
VVAKIINKKKAKAVKIAATKKQVIKTLDTETTKAPLKDPGAVLLKPGIELECETCPVVSYCECVGHSPVTLIDPVGFGSFCRKPGKVTCGCKVLAVSRSGGRCELGPTNRKVTIKQIVSIFSVKYPFPVGDDPTMMQWGVNQANTTFIVSKELCDANNP